MSCRALLTLAWSLCIVSCSDPKKASDANFQRAIQAKLDREPVCIGAEVPHDAPDWNGKSQPDAKLDTLVALGLVSVTRTQVEPGIFQREFGKKDQMLPGVRYDLTEKGKAFTRTDATGIVKKGGSSVWLCYAKKQVAEVVRYTEPAPAFGQTVSQVTYTYRLIDIADWAKDGAVQRAYSVGPEIQAATTPKEEKAVVVLTGHGWRSPDR